MTTIGQTTDLWADPKLVYAVAIIAILMLAATIWLFRRAKKEGRGAGAICLFFAVVLHGLLIWLVPYQSQQNGGSVTQDPSATSTGVEAFDFSTFDPSLDVQSESGDSVTDAIAPLPVAELDDLLAEQTVDLPPTEDSPQEPIEQTPPEPALEPTVASPMATPVSLNTPSTVNAESELTDLAADLQSSLDELLQSRLESDVPTEPEAVVVDSASDVPSTQEASATVPQPAVPPEPIPAKVVKHVQPAPASQTARATAAVVAGDEQADFANRVGAAKQIALQQTGGSAETEAAVQAALRFLSSSQHPNGSWDPRASGAGVERAPLGERRVGAGTKSTTGLTGLSLLAMMGAGNTHLRGDYADNVYRGLAYLIQHQHPDGALSGDATIYAASYCHSMAALSLCEAAVMTQDPSAIESARRAIGHTVRMQHPVTGGWRYTRGDPGDLSQLGWQAMVLDGGKRAGIEIRRENVSGVARFLRTVRAGGGGLACYRPGEATSRTMTAEALATRLLIGETVPRGEVDEAERYLLQALPGMRQDNYYYWYYATLALHQLQDDAWHRWNTALKQRLLATQRPDGSWPASTVWGGYGGTVYTTAMATLCLESYYRHAVRSQTQ
ncbi:squalene--hopene cyclase [Stieleria sp. TO1_6]|uniref:prenyltransferase/squalene oxidase repeat-containing protein n=1 Tax=Stieleria tagensis TaxID=2956795 RepID=UPI00209AF4E4|nr:squalene--hopene cyclase [Stieleria tagensis]MCO8124781.1 squalene--hopene cyclase [Stieleria tagensis]